MQLTCALAHASTFVSVEEENRERIGASEGLLERLVANLKRAQDVPMQKWTARALGNLSYEHGATLLCFLFTHKLII